MAVTMRFLPLVELTSGDGMTGLLPRPHENFRYKSDGRQKPGWKFLYLGVQLVERKIFRLICV